MDPIQFVIGYLKTTDTKEITWEDFKTKFEEKFKHNEQGLQKIFLWLKKNDPGETSRKNYDALYYSWEFYREVTILNCKSPFTNDFRC
jgi:hypothetical protein